jgi:hypothetical protein
MSRPRKKDTEQRCHQIIFRLNNAEFDAHCRRSNAAGLSPNELARQLTLKGGKTLAVKTTKLFDPAFLGRIDRVGRNLNQIVENAHTFGEIPPSVAKTCQAINQLVQEAMQEILNDS